MVWRVGGNWSAGMSAGRNQSEALGLGCQDKSGIEVVAATFLFKGVSKKKEGFGGKKLLGAVARLPEVAGGKSGSRWEFHGRLELSGAA